MEAFLSSLAQICVSLLALLAASYAAYGIFLNQQAAKFDDQIAHDKVEVRDRLWTIRSQWPQAFAFYISPEFKDRYRSNLGGKAGAEFVTQAAVDFLFKNDAMQRALSEVRPNDTMPGPEGGRVYLWTASEAVSFITSGLSGAADPQKGAFPSSAAGAGFEQWRRDFEQTRQVFTLLGISQSEALADFDKFMETRPAALRLRAALTANALKNLFDGVAAIGQLLRNIDEQTLLKRPYTLSERAHNTWILVLLILSFIAGVLAPLALLAVGEKANAIAEISLLSAAFALTLGAISVFGWDVLHGPAPNVAAYVANRWCAPLLAELKNTDSRLAEGGLLETGPFFDASGAVDRGSLPNGMLAALQDYLKNAEEYNRTALACNTKIIEAISNDQRLSGRLQKPPFSGQAVTLEPLQVFDNETLSGLKSNLNTNMQLGISIEVQMPRWRRVIAFLPPNDDNVSLITTINSIAQQLASDSTRTDFENARARVKQSAAELKFILESCS
jgi:hypothetical protein